MPGMGGASSGRVRPSPRELEADAVDPHAEPALDLVEHGPGHLADDPVAQVARQIEDPPVVERDVRVVVQIGVEPAGPRPVGRGDGGRAPAP
jgi:hypothetical protein